MKCHFNNQDSSISKLTKEDIFLLKNWCKIEKIIIKNPSNIKKIIKFVYSKYY